MEMQEVTKQDSENTKKIFGGSIQEQLISLTNTSNTLLSVDKILKGKNLANIYNQQKPNKEIDSLLLTMQHIQMISELKAPKEKNFSILNRIKNKNDLIKRHNINLNNPLLQAGTIFVDTMICLNKGDFYDGAEYAKQALDNYDKEIESIFPKSLFLLAYIANKIRQIYYTNKTVEPENLEKHKNDIEKAFSQIDKIVKNDDETKVQIISEKAHWHFLNNNLEKSSKYLLDFQKKSEPNYIEVEFQYAKGLEKITKKNNGYSRFIKEKTLKINTKKEV